MKVVLQDGIKDCGICCLLSIIRFYGGDVSKEYLREITNTTKEGVSLYNLLDGANKIGFEAIGLSGKLEEIDVNNLPCIAHINVNKSFKHFIVIYKINKDKQLVTVMDPAKGKKIISFSEYNLLSSNNYLFLKVVNKLPVLKKRKVIYRNIKTLIINNRFLIIFLSILTFNYFVCNIITSFHFKYLLEYSINYNISEQILTLCLIISVIYFFKNILNYLRNIMLNKWNSLFSISIMQETYSQILLLPYLFFKNRTTGEVISRFRDLNTVRDYLTTLFCTTTTDVISIIVFSIILMGYSFKLTIIFIINICVIIIYLFISNKYKIKTIKDVKKKEDVINSYLIQGISNVDTIKGSHLEKRFIDKFNINYKSFQEDVYKYNNINNFDAFISNTIHDFIFVFIYGIGSYLVIRDKLSLSNLLVYQTLIGFYMNSFINITNVFSGYHTYKVSLDRIEELFMLDKENFKNNYFYLPYTLDGKIVIKKLNYKIGTKLLFNNLSVVIENKEKILLVGESGSGKSTLIKMLLRYIEVDYDVIKISNIDINHYHLQNIRANITYITGNEYLFNDSIRNNICMYKDYNEEEIKVVCDICLVSDILSSKNISLNTIIEEDGFDLSNGERQRIVLARSLLKKTSIYIFDESLSAIDINREKKILEKIFVYLKDKTVIVISHRYNNKKLYDRILKLENGVLNESKKL